MIGAVEIPLTKGHVALISPEDADAVNEWKWSANETRPGRVSVNRGWNLGSKFGRKIVKVYLHRFLTNPLPWQEVDHINGNPLDNRRENLRVCSRSENMRNRSSSNRHGFKGVTLIGGLFYGHLTLPGGKQVYSSSAKTAEQAAHGYDRLAIMHHGEFACLNFPEDK